MKFLTIALLCSTSSFAFQFPFKLPFTGGVVSPEIIVPESPRVAIVGAGAGGSSAAFWISKAKERFGIDVEIDVFEREDYVGGRSTTVYPYNDKENYKAIELGASIFVRVNKNMWRASEEFNLTRISFEEDNSMGIWDGEKFVLTTGGSGWFSGWLSTLKVLWRYGYTAPTKTQNIVKGMIAQFVQLYTPSTPHWSNISSLASTFGWTDMVAQSTSEYFDTHGVNTKFSREMIEAATRVNYGQDVDKIHALEGACSLATNSASSVEGGNWRIFEQFLKRSNATVHLGETVQSIKRQSDEKWTVKTDRSSANYKAVIIAAPFHSTGISLPNTLASQIPPQPYVHLHVTLLTTTSTQPNPAYFALSSTAKVPGMVLTTYDGVRRGGEEPEFNSLSYHGIVSNGSVGVPDQWSVKIFSKERIEDDWLEKIFPGEVGWIYRKEWDAYPKLPPTTEFPPLKLDKGLYYVNAFEPFISTMETETISSRNVVDLMLDEAFSTGICGPAKSIEDDLGRPNADNLDEFVYGWDC